MKKLLNISVIAALAILPMAANATPTIGTVPAEPVDATANTNVASTSFVRGAYNAAVAVANAENARAKAAEGDLATLTTTQKGSLVGAINEINNTAGNAADKDLSNLSATGTGVITTAITNNAAGATYSNTTSGLSASTLQGAIDEIAGTAGNAADKDLSNISSAGETVITDLVTANAADGAYDNTTSGLTGDTLQEAIDEVEGRVDTAEGKIGNTTLTTTAQTLTGAINEINTTAGNAADKDLSNLSATGTGVITTAITNNAAGATYSNTTSGLSASTIQGAIDELAGDISDQGNKVLKVYTTWNTDTNQEVTLTTPTQP